MTLSILAISAISAFTLLAPGGGEMVSKQTPVSALEGNRIEQRAEVNQQDKFTYSMDKQVNERVAVNLPVGTSIYAVQPQAENSKSTSLAVYQDNQDNQGKESPMLAINSLHLENGNRIEDKQWTTAFSSPERTERTGRGLA